MNTEIVNFLLQAYPVGAIYISTVATPPSELFGGTWEAIGGRFLIGVDSTYTIGSTGGEATHTLSVSEMPSHSHAFNNISWGGKSLSYSLDNGNFTIYDASSAYPIGARYMKQVGSSQPHNNMPPYLAVYMWKRIK